MEMRLRTFEHQSQPWECLENPRHSVILFDFFFHQVPLPPLSVHRHSLPHLKYESEGSFSRTPTPG